MSTQNGAVDPRPAAGRPASAPPDPEVTERARRRQFSASYKLRILEESDSCRVPGQLGALLRREGLYSSHLVEWRRQRAAGALAALAPQRRGRPAASVLQPELNRLRAENERLARQLAAAEAIIEVQKKVSALLELSQPSDSSGRRR